MSEQTRVSGVVLLRPDDGAALLQHRDDKPNLAHAGLWVPPGGHCDCAEAPDACARREFFEETNYHCAALRHLADVDVDGVLHALPIRLSMFWDVYDGRQPIVCREGQGLAFVARRAADVIPIPPYLLALWDRAVSAWRSEAGSHRWQR